MTPLMVAIVIVQSPVVGAGTTFLGSLSPDQKNLALYASGSESLFNWHYVPRVRPGIPLNRLSADQKLLAQTFLKSCISDSGFDKVEAIRALEDVLFALENRNPARNREAYNLAFFGEPHLTKPWVWRFEGHHVSLTFAFRGGRLVGSTPQFLGSNPANRSPRVLGETQDLAFALLDSLSNEARKKAVISDRTLGDIATRSSRVAKIDDRGGISFKELDSRQRLALIFLLSAHADVQTEPERKRRMAKIGEQDPADLKFAWMGSLRPGAPHYYRILGKDLIVEYDNSEGNGTHIHTVWRVPSEDFGGDPLTDHYQNGHRHR
jgi:hypothetical protein